MLPVFLYFVKNNKALKNLFRKKLEEDDENTPTRLMFFDLSDYKNQLKDIQ